MIVFLLLVIGLQWPEVSIAIGALQFVARWFYVYGYKKGPKWRSFGAYPILISLFALMILAIVVLGLIIADTNPFDV